MVTKEQIAASALYANLMEEIKVRINAIDVGTRGNLPLFHPLTREFCYLQLRMICELIALGCLVAHGDLIDTKKLKKEWAADKIVDLGEAAPRFLSQTIFKRNSRYRIPHDSNWRSDDEK